MCSKIVVRLVNKNNLIVDSLISNFASETLAVKQAFHDRHWIISDGDSITINKEWFEEDYAK